jgi:hypothetical protein
MARNLTRTIAHFGAIMKSDMEEKDGTALQRRTYALIPLGLSLDFCRRTNLIPSDNLNRIDFQAVTDGNAIFCSVTSVEIATAIEARSITPA